MLTTRDPRYGYQHPALDAAILSLSYDFLTRTATVLMPDLCCTDFPHTIAFFTTIDPDVQRIDTFQVDPSTGHPFRDTSYIRDRSDPDGWRVLLHPEAHRTHN